MFFLLSKTIYFLAKPFSWVVVSFLLSILVKRRRKFFFRFGFGLLLLFSNPFASNLVMRAWEVPPVPVASLSTYEVGIVLGGITTDKEPRDRVHVSGSADRVLHAVQLYRRGKIKKVLVSGGSGKIFKDQVPEAELLKRLLLLSGVPASAIITESASRNTRENAVNCAQLLDRDYPNRRHLLITSAYHLRRAAACFRKVKLPVDSYGVDFRSDEPAYTPDELLLPSTGALEGWEVVVRELVGIVAYTVAGYI